ncbi:hypothetical protein K438DRAFT_1760391 [Mycena galopus ATCC 62051]|nr:hypothetical protein K438DRAFT_1760391 [Mycena galopus ATCC 62051]
MPPRKGPLWDYYARGAKKNTAHYEAFCVFCIKHHLGPDHPANRTLGSMSSLHWDEPSYAQARQAAGSILGVKDSMIAHLIGTTPCPHATDQARKRVKAIKAGTTPPATTSAPASDSEADEAPVPKKKKIFHAVEKVMNQPELQVYRGANIPFSAAEVDRVKAQFLRATISANIPFRWTEDIEVIKLFLMFRAMACNVMPTRDVLSGRLLDEASEEVERLLGKELRGATVVLSTDGWKDDSKNSITGVNVATSQKAERKFQSYLVDLLKSNGEKKDGVAMCTAFEKMIDKTEQKYGCIVVLFCCDNDGGSQRGRKDLGIKRPWIFVVPCCAHQGQLILGEYFIVNDVAARIAEQATELVGWILSHGRVRNIFDKSQFAKNVSVLVYLVANLTRWTTHYLAFSRLLELKAPLRHAAYLQRSEIIDAQVGAEKNVKAKAKMIATANKQCDLIENNDFWTGLQTVVDDIEPICYATNINQADRTRADQVLLCFAGLYRHFHGHSIRRVSQDMCARIEKRWDALDQPLFVFCLILNHYEVLERFGDKAGLSQSGRFRERFGCRFSTRF